MSEDTVGGASLPEPKTCLENYRNCGAACCRFYCFTTKEMSDDLRHYFSLHANTVVDGKTVLVMNKCNMLDDATGKCKVYGTRKMPVLCRDGYTKIKQGVFFPDKCIYKPKAGEGQLAQQ